MQESAPIRVLVIDDEKVIRDGCTRALADRGYEVASEEDGKSGIASMLERDFDIVLLDLMMPGIDGFSVLKWIRQEKPATLAIVITGFATVDKAVTAMKEGAFDFVGKPFSPEYIRLVVQRAAEKRSLLAEAEMLRQERTLDLRIIAEEQSRLKTVFSCMEGAILVTDRQKVVVLHNPAAIKLLEIQTDPVVGKPLSASIRDQGAVSMVAEVVKEGTTILREFPPGTISRQHLRSGQP
jgi:DNA-binding response OmpR family regulator